MPSAAAPSNAGKRAVTCVVRRDLGIDQDPERKSPKANATSIAARPPHRSPGRGPPFAHRMFIVCLDPCSATRALTGQSGAGHRIERLRDQHLAILTSSPLLATMLTGLRSSLTPKPHRYPQAPAFRPCLPVPPLRRGSRQSGTRSTAPGRCRFPRCRGCDGNAARPWRAPPGRCRPLVRYRERAHRQRPPPRPARQYPPGL